MYTHRMCGKYWSAEAALVGVGEYKRSGEKGFGKERVAGIRGERESRSSSDALLPSWMLTFHQVHTAESINGTNNHD